MEPRFADLHCHPHMRSYNWLHSHRKPETNSKYNPWWIILPNFAAEEKGKRAATYSQCDLAKVANGNLKLAFVSLYPLEQGWVTSTGKGSENENLQLRDFLQTLYMRIPLKRILFVKGKKYDYFKELKEEKAYLDKANKQFNKTRLVIPKVRDIFVSKKKMLEEYPEQLKAEGTYVMAKHGRHVEEIISDNNTAFVLTIEGANVFNTNDRINKIIDRIKEIKAWEEPVFFMTLTHHFYNQLAGHAHSIPGIGKLVLDQSEGINSGFTEKGIKVTRFLLSLDEHGNYKPQEFGRRILIDVKHMNAVSRKEYYEKFVIPSLTTQNPIPVLASHVAFSGRAKLDELIRDMKNEKDGDFSKRNGFAFNNWNINLCDEDVMTIFKSGGLIGINLDQRVLGTSKDDVKNESTHGNYVWQNIRAMMKVVMDSPEIKTGDKKNAAKLFCLGTDFDGYIDPLNKYPTVLQFDDLRKDLIGLVNKDPDKGTLTAGMSTEAFVDGFCFTNAYDFVVKNFK